MSAEMLDREKILNAIELSREAISINSPEGVILYTNPAMDELFGCQKGELIGKPPSVLNAGSEQEAATMVNTILDSLKKEGFWEGEIRNRRKDGIEFVSWAKISAQKDEQGQIINIVTSQRDITKQRRIEDALQESEVRFRAIFDNATVGILIADADNKMFRFSNPAICQMLGYDSEEIRHLGVEDVHPENERSSILALFDKLAKGEIARVEQIPVKRKDGEIIYCDISVALITLQNHNFMAGFFRDMTEHRREEEALRESEEKYRVLTEKSLQGTIIAQGVPPRIVFANQAIADMLGYSIKDLTSLDAQEITRLIYPDDRALFFGRFADRLAGKEVVSHYQVRGVRKDGRVIEMEIVGNRITYKGEPAVIANFVDITERKLAEEKSKASELRYRRLFEAAKDGILILDYETGAIVDVNPFLEKLLGFSAAELLGKQLWEIGVFKDILVSKEAFTKLQAEDYIRYEDLPLKTADGRKTEVEFVSNVYMVDGTKVIQCNIRDITERRRAEEELKEERERLDLALRSAGMGVWRYEIADNKRYFDDQVCRLLGLEPTKFNGTTEEFFGALHPDDREKVKAALDQTINNDAEYQPEYRAVWPDGSIHFINARGKLVRDKSGQPLRINGIIWDVSEQKQEEAELLKLKKAVESSGEVIFITDQDGLITYVNPEFSKVYGYTVAEIVGKTTPRILKSGAMRPEEYKNFWDTIKNMKVVKGELINKCKDGRLVPIESSANSILDEAGKIVGFLAIQRDITDRKQAEEELSKKIKELETFYQAAMGREDRIIELKEQIKEQKKRLGEK